MSPRAGDGVDNTRDEKSKTLLYVGWALDMASELVYCVAYERVDGHGADHIVLLGSPSPQAGRQPTLRAPMRRMSLKLRMYCAYAIRLLMLSVTSSPPVNEPPDQFWEPVVTCQLDESPL